jgi:hypothetical protein
MLHEELGSFVVKNIVRSGDQKPSQAEGFLLGEFGGENHDNHENGCYSGAN